MNIFGKTPAQTGVVHFIGIGGIGMSGLAEVLARSGFTVQGSDAGHGYTEDVLTGLGVNIFHGHAANQLGQAALVVVSTAIAASNPELLEAKQRGLQVVHRAAVLAEIMRNYQTIAVAGTHGKTTTTALVYTALKAAGVPVGIINGGVLNDVGSNVVLPPKPGAWLVVEADESDASFLQLKPTLAIITNIEAEHMDTYGSEEKLLQAFIDFAAGTEAVVVGNDGLAELAAAQLNMLGTTEVITYGLDPNSELGLDAYATLWAHALAALCIAQILKTDVNAAAAGLENFAGVGRRFSSVGRLNGQTNGPEIIDDYGHHPTEIATTLAAAKASTAGKVVAVIQPHRYTRLRDTLDAFASCALGMDGVIVLPVHSAGEPLIEDINSGVLLAKMAAAGVPVLGLAEDVHALRSLLSAQKLGPSDLVVCLGAGSISGMAKELTQ
jgi:UDP-N-acetylmuramate--alanine ligase